jgi:hypothetical protein
MGSMGGARVRASCLAIARVASRRSAVCTYDTSGVATTHARSRPIDRAAGPAYPTRQLAGSAPWLLATASPVTIYKEPYPRSQQEGQVGTDRDAWSRVTSLLVWKDLRHEQRRRSGVCCCMLYVHVRVRRGRPASSYGSSPPVHACMHQLAQRDPHHCVRHARMGSLERVRGFQPLPLPASSVSSIHAR